MTSEIIQFVKSPAKLDRDRGLNLLTDHLAACSPSDIQECENNILGCFQGNAPWEAVLGGLLGAKTVIEHVLMSTEEFVMSITSLTVRYLEHEEFRVRIAAGELLGALAKLKGVDLYLEHHHLILTSIRTNLDRDLGNCDTDGSSTSVRDANQIFHDSAGWKSLETWMKCLQCVIEGCGNTFNPCIDQTLLDLLFCSLTHTNRFVRETGYYVCAALVGINQNTTDVSRENNAICHYGDQFSEYLARGLSDNWSMVRLAASVATRKFFTSLPNEASREAYYPVLLPRMCLNRYYVAEGVRIYSQDTWAQVCGGRGKELVETYIQHVVDHYIEQTQAENHAVREAACSCIAELGYKIDRHAVSPHIHRLLDTLLVCFRDDSWPVRDSACVACGNFVKCFPEESRPSLEALYPLFFANLHDNIPSVRQGAAQAIANVVRAYGQESAVLVLQKIREGLAGVEQQSSESEKYSGLSSEPGNYGVVKRLRDNDMDLHTEQQMYSCGSLAPKMGRGNRGGGCMDHKFKKPSEPWELADGCIHLTAELSSIPDLNTSVSQILGDVVKSVSHHHYTHHVVLMGTFCSRLSDIAKGIGKRNFKCHIEDMLDSIFYSLTCDNHLTIQATSQCLRDLSTFIGPGILRGRIEQHNPAYARPQWAMAHPGLWTNVGVYSIACIMNYNRKDIEL